MSSALFLLMLTLMSVAADSNGGCTVYRTLRVFRNETAVLPCHELVNVSFLQVWAAPDGQNIIGPNDNNVKYSVDRNDGSLRVYESVKKDSGRYKCIQRSGDSTSQYITTETVLEVIDVSYLPEIDNWQANLARGLIAAGSTAAFFIAACGIKHFSWYERQPDNNKAKQRRRRQNHTVTSSFDQRGSAVGGGSGRLRTIGGSLTVSSSSGVQGSGSSVDSLSSSLDDETVKMTTMMTPPTSFIAESTINEGIDNPALLIDTKEEQKECDSPL